MAKGGTGRQPRWSIQSTSSAAARTDLDALANMILVSYILANGLVVPFPAGDSEWRTRSRRISNRVMRSNGGTGIFACFIIWRTTRVNPIAAPL